MSEGNDSSNPATSAPDGQNSETSGQPSNNQPPATPQSPPVNVGGTDQPTAPTFSPDTRLEKAVDVLKRQSGLSSKQLEKSLKGLTLEQQFDRLSFYVDTKSATTAKNKPPLPTPTGEPNNPFHPKKVGETYRLTLRGSDVITGALIKKKK